jgi:hypothetical protein
MPALDILIPLRRMIAPAAPTRPDQAPNAETVETLVETVRKFLDVEDAREQSVNTRAGGVVVFGGVALSLLLSIARPILVVDLADGWDEAAVTLFAAAIVALLAAVTMTLFYVLVPRQSASIAMEEIERYGELETLRQEPIEVNGVLLEGLIRLLAIDRERVSMKTTWLVRAYGALFGGLLAVSALGLILAAEVSGLL